MHHPLTRRHLLHSFAVGSALLQPQASSAPAPSAASPATAPSPAAPTAPSVDPRQAIPHGIIDTHVWLGSHPTRALAEAGPLALADALRRRHVAKAWACSFELMLHRDITAMNDRIAIACLRSGGLLQPVGGINPMLPGWRRDVETCVTMHSMKAIRVLPGLHGYALDSAEFRELLSLATTHRLIVQIVAQLEDERTQHPLLRAPAVDLRQLPATAATVMVHNVTAATAITALRHTAAIIDTGMIEGVGGLENLLREWPAERLVFGSHSPWFYWEANALKLVESELPDAARQAITSGTAARLMG